MREINKVFYKTIVLIFFFFSVQAESNISSIGDPDAKVIIKVFSSLTCPHCANFHTSTYDKLKKNVKYISIEVYTKNIKKLKSLQNLIRKKYDVQY